MVLSFGRCMDQAIVAVQAFKIGTGNQKCVPDNTIITPIGFDGQYMLMDFTNNLIMIRFSLYLPVEQANSKRR